MLLFETISDYYMLTLLYFYITTFIYCYTELFDSVETPNFTPWSILEDGQSRRQERSKRKGGKLRMFGGFIQGLYRWIWGDLWFRVWGLGFDLISRIAIIMYSTCSINKKPCCP